jgi:hypothetical protein
VPPVEACLHMDWQWWGPVAQCEAVLIYLLARVLVLKCSSDVPSVIPC